MKHSRFPKEMKNDSINIFNQLSFYQEKMMDFSKKGKEWKKACS